MEMKRSSSVSRLSCFIRRTIRECAGGKRAHLESEKRRERKKSRVRDRLKAKKGTNANLIQ